METMLDNYSSIKDLKKYTTEELKFLAEDIRSFLIDNVSTTGGHLASNLGVVELTLSLFEVFNFDKDKIVWDVGHQAYVHKILTGRKQEFTTLRTFGGMSGFPKRCESKYDAFETGHSSTSISAALGMARARDVVKQDHNVIAVIGDGALTGGMAFEALNDVGFKKTKMIIVLNDNAMSIAENVGSLSSYLSKIRVKPEYNRLKKQVSTSIKHIPGIGNPLKDLISDFKNGIKQAVVPSMLFEDMGLQYFGPIDGHNMEELVHVLGNAKEIDGPVLIHVVTKKGKGYKFAEKNPGKFHSVGPFDTEIGKVGKGSGISYSKAFGEEMVELGKNHKEVVAITAAMPDGTGLNSFASQFPDRFFDVGIAEQHAVTLSAGMASAGLKPVFAVYSTFLQRAYDQVLHDVCIQNLPVVFAIDRAGIVGKDGETHQGVFDLSFLSHIPNMNIMSPKCIEELRKMLAWAVVQNKPIAIRYPRGGDDSIVSSLKPMEEFEFGKWEILKEESSVAIIASGKMVSTAIKVEEAMREGEKFATIVNACFIKPIDMDLIDNLVKNHKYIITLEDNVIHGGLGSAVLQYVNKKQYTNKVLNLGFEDEFIPHGDPEILYKTYGMDKDGVLNKILNWIK